MGRLIDLTNKTFKHLTVIRRVDDNILPAGLKEPMWLCQCDCGNRAVVRGSFLRTGHTSSCGCKQTGTNFIDLTMMRFGRILVLERASDEVQPNGRVIVRWSCQCDCGKKFITRGSSLKSGHTKSCGCRKKQLRKTDMIGRQFSKLTVISRASDHVNPNGTRYIQWNCLCECGNKTVVRGTSLRDEKTSSCGCYRLERLANKVLSKAELWVKNYLDDHDISYRPQKTYPTLFGIGDGLLSYDFFIPRNNKSDCLVECQGLQHYKPVDYFGGPAQFKMQQEHDRRKRLFAKKHGIQLIEIPYFAHTEAEVIECLVNNLSI